MFAGLSFFNIWPGSTPSLSFSQWLLLPEVQAFFNLFFALLLGALIGLERTYRGRQAGVRTYALVCLASSSLVACFVSLMPPASPHTYDAISRTIQGLLTGLGFLGAGIIVRDGLKVRGLTTAASVWLTSIIGIICGFGQLSLAFLVAFCSWLILVPLRGIENLVIPKRQRFTRFHIEFDPLSEFQEPQLRALIQSLRMTLLELSISKSTLGYLRFEVLCVYYEDSVPHQFAQRLMELKDPIHSFNISSAPDEKSRTPGSS